MQPSVLWKVSGLQLRCLTAGEWPTDDSVKKKNGSKRKEGERSTVTLLRKHSFAQPIYLKSGSVIYCKLKNKTKTKTSHRLVQAVQTTLTLIKAIRWLNLIQCPLWVLTARDIASGKSSVKTTARQVSTLEAHRRLGKQTQRHRGVQSAEWRCNLSSKVSALFLPVLFSAVRDVPLADEGGNCSSVLVPLRWCLYVSCGRCSWLALWQPLWVCCCCCWCCSSWVSTFFSFLWVCLEECVSGKNCHGSWQAVHWTGEWRAQEKEWNHCCSPSHSSSWWIQQGSRWGGPSLTGHAGRSPHLLYSSHSWGRCYGKMLPLRGREAQSEPHSFS